MKKRAAMQNYGHFSDICVCTTSMRIEFLCLAVAGYYYYQSGQFKMDLN